MGFGILVPYKNIIVSVDLFEACEKNLQNFSLSQKIGLIPQKHSKVSVANLSLI